MAGANLVFARSTAYRTDGRYEQVVRPMAVNRKNSVKVPQRALDQLKTLACTSILDALDHLGYDQVFMCAVRTLITGRKVVGRAVTLRFLPVRPDLRQEVRSRSDSAEYRAMELCGPGDVLVIDAMGLPFASVGGDIKFLRLKRRGAAGLVTDGAVRDMAMLKTYGYAIFAQNPTAKAGPTDMLPYEENVYIQCGGVLVKPGDIVCGDDDGVVVVPQALVNDVIQEATKDEALEAWIRQELETKDVSPGRYYPVTEATKKAFTEAQQRRRRRSR
jgi:regulator of RNase E activity RraA